MFKLFGFRKKKKAYQYLTPNGIAVFKCALAVEHGERFPILTKEGRTLPPLLELTTVN